MCEVFIHCHPRHILELKTLAWWQVRNFRGAASCVVSFPLIITSQRRRDIRDIYTIAHEVSRGYRITNCGLYSLQNRAGNLSQASFQKKGIQSCMLASPILSTVIGDSGGNLAIDVHKEFRRVLCQPINLELGAYVVHHCDCRFLWHRTCI